jgi:hypothetical protein
MLKKWRNEYLLELVNLKYIVLLSECNILHTTFALDLGKDGNQISIYLVDFPYIWKKPPHNEPINFYDLDMSHCINLALKLCKDFTIIKFHTYIDPEIFLDFPSRHEVREKFKALISKQENPINIANWAWAFNAQYNLAILKIRDWPAWRAINFLEEADYIFEYQGEHAYDYYKTIFKVFDDAYRIAPEKWNDFQFTEEDKKFWPKAEPTPLPDYQEIHERLQYLLPYGAEDESDVSIWASPWIRQIEEGMLKEDKYKATCIALMNLYKANLPIDDYERPFSKKDYEQWLQDFEGNAPRKEFSLKYIGIFFVICRLFFRCLK